MLAEGGNVGAGSGGAGLGGGGGDVGDRVKLKDTEVVTNKLFQSSTMTARKHASLTSSVAVQSYITRGSVQLAKTQNKKTAHRLH